MQPENLVFGNDTLAPVKICDFGLSKVLDSSGSTDTPCGTVGYLAPEIAKEQAHNFGVDIWGLGCVLYSLYALSRGLGSVRDICILTGSNVRTGARARVCRLCGFPVFYDESVPVLTDKVKRGIYDFPSPWWDTVSDSGTRRTRTGPMSAPTRPYQTAGRPGPHAATRMPPPPPSQGPDQAMPRR